MLCRVISSFLTLFSAIVVVTYYLKNVYSILTVFSEKPPKIRLIFLLFLLYFTLTCCQTCRDDDDREMIYDDVLSSLIDG